MRQTTRCPSCATLFKVVPDQLRISDGWVRCGQCREVFDATLSMQEDAVPVPMPVPMPMPVPVPAPAPSDLVSAPPAAPAASLDQTTPEALLATALSTEVLTDPPASEAAPVPLPMASADPVEVGEVGELGADDGTLLEALEPPSVADTDVSLESEQELDIAPLQAPPLQGYELPAAVLAEENEGFETYLQPAMLAQDGGQPLEETGTGLRLDGPVRTEQNATNPATPDALLLHPAPAPTAAKARNLVQETAFSPVLKAPSLAENSAVPGHGLRPAPDLAEDNGMDGWNARHGEQGERKRSARTALVQDGDVQRQSVGDPSFEALLPPPEGLQVPMPMPMPAPEPGLEPEPESDRQFNAGPLTKLDEEAPDSLRPAAQEPSFVRSARRKALWHRPAVRLALGGGVLLLAATLLAQVAVQQRHYLASAQPQWRATLQALCLPLQCDVQPYRQIAAVSVDSSSFNKLRGSTYRFALALKNQSALEVALPAVELTLTDASEQLLLRRVFTPAELAAPATLAPGGEWLGSLDMEMELQLPGNADARIAGYRVLAFYP